jgi:hypothetical protein
VFMGVCLYSPGDTLRAHARTHTHTQTKLLKVFCLVEFVVLFDNRYVRFAVKFVRAMNLIGTPVITSEERKCFKFKHARAFLAKVQCRV